MSLFLNIQISINYSRTGYFQDEAPITLGPSDCFPLIEWLHELPFSYEVISIFFGINLF